MNTWNALQTIFLTKRSLWNGQRNEVDVSENVRELWRVLLRKFALSHYEKEYHTAHGQVATILRAITFDYDEGHMVNKSS